MKLKTNISLILTMISLILLSNCDSNTGGKNLQLPKSPHKISPLIIGTKIPDILLTDIDGNGVELKTIISHKPTILIYYRGIWDLYCNQQLSQINEFSREIFDLGYQIIAVSADKISKNIELSEKYELVFPLLSDSTMEGAKSLGIAYDAKEVYIDILLVLEENSGMNHSILPVPSVFILNRDAVIVFEYINPDFKIRISPELLLTACKVAYEQ